MPTKQGLTDLERGKYIPGGDNESSTVRVRPDQPVDVNVLGQPVDVALTGQPIAVTLDEPIDTHVTNVPDVHVTNVPDVHITNIPHAIIDNIVNVAITGQPINVAIPSLPVPVAITGQPINVAVTGQPLQIRPTLDRVQGFNFTPRYLVGPGSSVNQKVVGTAGAPIDFTYTFPVEAYLRRLDLVMAAVNVVTYLDYGNISGGLTNGVQFIRKRSGVETVIFNAQSLIEFGHFIDDQLGQIQIIQNPTEVVVIASLTFEPAWKFAAGDIIISRVRDDLTTLRYHRSSLLTIDPI